MGLPCDLCSSSIWYDSPGIALRGARPPSVFRKALPPRHFKSASILCITFMRRHPACPGPEPGEPSHFLRACRTPVLPDGRVYALSRHNGRGQQAWHSSGLSLPLPCLPCFAPGVCTCAPGLSGGTCLILDVAPEGDPVVEPALLQEVHDCLIAPCKVAERHCPSANTETATVSGAHQFEIHLQS